MTLTAIARELGTSPVYLGALFRKQVGMSFKRHLLERRMQAAAVALEKGGAVKDAALSCGYKSASHFDRDFKRRFGTTPGAWRRSARGREISVQTAPDGLPGRP